MPAADIGTSLADVIVPGRAIAEVIGKVLSTRDLPRDSASWEAPFSTPN